MKKRSLWFLLVAFIMIVGTLVPAAIAVGDPVTPVTLTLSSGTDTMTAGSTASNPAYAEDVYVSGAATQTAGWTAANPQSDPLNAGSYGVAWNAAVSFTGHSAWANAASLGASWVSTAAGTDGNQGNENTTLQDEWRLFSATINVPSGVTSASLQIAADNAYAVYLNDISSVVANSNDNGATVYGDSPGSGPSWPFGTITSYNFAPAAGTNTLYFVVRNWNYSGPGNPTGLLYRVSLKYTKNAQLLPASYSGSWTNASVISSIPSPWAAISGASWVSTTSANSGVENANEGDAWRLFKHDFTIPNGATGISGSIQVAGDNAYEVYLNESLINTTDSVAPVYGSGNGNTAPYSSLATINISPVAGPNTLMFVVRNWNNNGQANPTGLLYQANIQFDPDLVPPTVTATPDPAPNGAGWNNSDVTVTFGATDEGGSGVATVDLPVTVSTEGAGQVITGTATDIAGNVGSASITLNIDKTKPVVTITAPADGGYYKTVDVPAAVYTVTDNLDPAPVVAESGYSTDDGVQTYIVSATDAADNVGSAEVTYTVETIAPIILINYPVDQAIYKLGTMSATPDISVSDEYDGSPKVVVTGYDTTLGTHTMTVTAVDAAGNTSTASVIYQVQKNPKTTLDKTGPVITIISPKAKTYYTYQTLKIFFGVKDKDSGVATKQATLDGTVVKNLQKIDLSTLSIGSHAFTVTATDNLGNSSTKTVIFTVAVGVLKARIDVMPSTLNLKSRFDKNAVTAQIWLPCGVSEKNIVLSTVTMTINGVTIPATAVVDNGSRRCGYTVKFDRQAVINALGVTTGKITVTVSGALKDGTTFSGTDTITVTNGPTPWTGGGPGFPGHGDRGHDKD